MTKKKTRTKSSLFLIVAFVALICYFCVSFFNLRTQVHAKSAEIDSLKQQIQMEQDQNAELEQLLAEGDLNAFVEKRARDEDLGYIYPDERVYYDLNAGK